MLGTEDPSSLGRATPRQAEGQRSGPADLDERFALRARRLRSGSSSLEDNGNETECLGMRTEY